MWQLSDPLTEPNVLLWGGFWLGVFLANPGRLRGWGATLWFRNPLLSSDNFTQGHLMKMQLLVTDWQSRTCYFWGDFDWAWFFASSGHIYSPWATLWGKNSLLSSDNFTQGHLMKMKLLVTNVTAIGTPGRAECAILGVILAGRVCGQFRTYLWSLSHFVM